MNKGACNVFPTVDSTGLTICDGEVLFLLVRHFSIITSTSDFVNTPRSVNAHSILLFTSDGRLSTDIDGGHCLYSVVSEAISTTGADMSSLTFVTLGAAIMLLVKDGTVFLLVVATGSGSANRNKESSHTLGEWPDAAHAWNP